MSSPTPGMMAATDPTRQVLIAFESEYASTRALCEGAIGQLSDDQLHIRINPLQNSVATVMRHMAGNMRSRWTDLLTADGEKPWRDREGEFVERVCPRMELLSDWTSGWAALFGAIGALTDADLSRTVTIRNEQLTVLRALVRQDAHYAVHAGQILVIAKHILGDGWSWITIPPGGSAAFNLKHGLGGPSV